MMLNTDVDISKFTDPHATEDERLDAGMSFMSHLYYGKKMKSLGSLRCSFFSEKQTTPALKSSHPLIIRLKNMSNEHAFKLWYGKLSIMWLSIEAPLLNVRCTCKAAKVNCTSYCKCIDDQCSNEFTIEQDTRDETFADGVAED